MSTATTTSTLPRGFIAADATEVREWAGLPIQKGRLPKPVIQRFNEAHATGKGRRKYVGAAATQTRTYSAKPEKGRAVTVKARPAEVRAWATENGYEVGERGRLPRATEAAFVLARRGV